MILYGMLSPHVAKIRAALQIKKLKYDSVSVDLKNKSPEFMNITKVGQIPVLDDNGTIIFDSYKILQYLDEKYPENPIFPTNIEEKVMVGKVCTLVDHMIEDGAKIFRKNMGILELSQEEESNIKERIIDKIKYLQSKLGEKKFFVGDTITVAEIYLAILVVLANNKLSIKTPLITWAENIHEEYIDKMFPSADEEAVNKI